MGAAAAPPDPLTDPTAAAPRTRGRRSHPLLRFVLRRIGGGLLTLLVVSMLVFAATEVLPGDAAGAILGRNATEENLAEVRELMGLDAPAAQRYLEWLGGIVTLDLGNSAAGYAQGTELPIWDEVSGKLTNSLVLAGIAALLLVPLSLVLGVVAAVRAGRPTDHAISLTSLAVISLPEFVVGSLLILVFFSWLDVLPSVSLIPPNTSPLDKPEALVLPVLTLLGVTLAASIRMVRAGMLEALKADYVQMARLNGYREGMVVRRYALRNALAPSVQVFAQNIQYLIGGIIIVEYLFAYPGLGKELVDAVAIRDVREVQSLALLVAAIYITINIVADLLVVLLVPRLMDLAVTEVIGRRLRFARSGSGAVGLAIFVAVLLVALIGPWFAPYGPDESIGIPLEGRSEDAPLGYDFLGRDVLSRVLWGGRSVFLLAGAATVLAYLLGTAIGLLAGFARSLLDPLLMRGVDVMLSFPALLFLLVLITGTGTSEWVLVLGVAAVQAPLVARIIRTATLEQSVRGFVEAATARGERTSAILRREILPNITPVIAADIGLRFTYSIILVASVNFLGLGLQPPAADWALMISENRDGLDLNPWSVLAPAAMIALLTISVNLIGDAVARSLGRSTAGSASA